MRTLAAFGAACLSLFVALPQLAEAQMIRRAENAVVELMVLPPEDVASGVLSSGDTLWVERSFPVYVARLVDEAPERTRPRRGAPLEAGTVLFGLSVTNGVAYCPPIDFDAPVRRVQCFRDLDDNGTFDGRYLTRSYGIDSQYLAAFVHALDRAPQIAYERLQPTPDMATSGRIVFDGFRRGEPSFRRYLDDERLDSRFTCEPVDSTTGTCRLLGALIRITRQGNDGISFEIVDVPDVRYLGVESRNTGL
ncbi:hypothetical protein [Maricaulis sp.]|uniref:hypothetical protein n=1 Tax=Maricaulis sp. TaxID=1486257 RepID=UPI002635D0F2|nr:hypothetical protein [Maricaulis sp.]